MLFLLLACGLGAPQYSVHISAPRVTVLPSIGQLHERCGPDTFACTFIRGLHFSATCDQDPAGWRARVDLSIVPYTFLGGGPGRQPRDLAHEIEHLRDIQQDLIRYARPLAIQRFSSKTECTGVVAQKSAQFYDRVRDFAANSQRARQ